MKNKYKLSEYKYKFIEEELKQHKFKKMQMQNTEDNILNSASYDCKEYIDNSGYISNSTAKKAIDLAEKCDPGGWIRTIKEALDSLSQQHRIFFILKYNKDYTWKEIQRALKLKNKYQCKELKHEIILMVAVKKKWVSE